MDKRLLDELSARLAGLMPTANELRQETRAKVEQTLKHGLKELDVLTRESLTLRPERWAEHSSASRSWKPL